MAFRKDNSAGTRIGKEEILDNPENYFLKVSNFSDLLVELGDTRINVIYSQWEGYKKQVFNPAGYKKFVDLENNPNIDFHDVHTSGHAMVGDLQKLARAVDAKMLVPIHTEHAKGYKTHFPNVHVMDDGEVFSV